MPGIIGLLTPPGFTDLPVMASDMADRMRHHPWYVEHRHVDPSAGLALGRVSLGFTNTAEQPSTNEERSLLAVMEGEVYDYVQQRRSLTASGHTFRGDSHAELLLHGYEEAGRDYFRRLDGMFAAAIWDSRHRRLILVNDRFGMKPLYYAQTAGRFLVASEIKALMVDPDLSRRYDPRGIAQFFYFGQPLGEQTFFEDVQALPAAAWVVYDADREHVEVGRYWRLEPGAVGQVSTSEALDRIDRAFHAAVQRRLPGARNLGLSLSGGLDSRTILGVIDTRRTKVTTVSMGVEGSLDHRSAEQMAALAGCTHHQVYLDTKFVENYEAHLRSMVRLTDGHHLSQCVATPTIPTYRDLGIDVLMRGHAGELMHMNKAYNFTIDAKAARTLTHEDLAPWLFEKLGAFVSSSELLTLFAGSKGGPMRDLARESLHACLEESSGMDSPSHRIWHLFLTQRLRRETALSMAEFGALVEPRLPFLDNDLIDTLFAAPAGLKRGDQIQEYILRRHRPEFLRVLNANNGTRMGASRLEILAGTLKLKVLSKLQVRGYQPYESLGVWLRNKLRPLVTRVLLDDRCLDRGIFDPDAVRTVVDDHLTSRRNHTFLLMALLIFEVGRREFDDGDAWSPGTRLDLSSVRTAS